MGRACALKRKIKAYTSRVYCYALSLVVVTWFLTRAAPGSTYSISHAARCGSPPRPKRLQLRRTPIRHCSLAPLSCLPLGPSCLTTICSVSTAKWHADCPYIANIRCFGNNQNNVCGSCIDPSCTAIQSQCYKQYVDYC